MAYARPRPANNKTVYGKMMAPSDEAEGSRRQGKEEQRETRKIKVAATANV